MQGARRAAMWESLVGSVYFTCWVLAIWLCSHFEVPEEHIGMAHLG